MFHSSVTVTSFNQDSIRETPRVRIPHDSTITQLRQIHQTVCVGHHGAVQEIPYGKEQKLSVCKVISWFCTGEIRSGLLSWANEQVFGLFIFFAFSNVEHPFTNISTKKWARICWAARPPPPPRKQKKKTPKNGGVEMMLRCVLVPNYVLLEGTEYLNKKQTSFDRRMSRKTVKVR